MAKAITIDFFSGKTALVTLPVVAPKARPKGKAPKAAWRALAVPASYVAGPKAYPKHKRTWAGYMVAVTLKASNPADATKLHKARAARAGYPAKRPLDFRWMLGQGYIA